MIRVTCALIEKKDKVLITQRSASMSQPLLWEFPGGKIEGGESEEECLVREIREELSLHIKCMYRLTPCKFNYPNFTIELIPYICTLEGGAVSLLEHAAYEWVGLDELSHYNWCPADIPIVEEYMQYKKSNGSQKST